MTYLVDANVPMYAAGKPHSYRDPCVRILAACLLGVLDCATDAEVLQEILHRYAAIGRREDAFVVAEDFASVVPRVLPITMEIIGATVELMRGHPDLPSRDAIHIAVAQNAGISHIISADRHMDAVGGVTRIDPAELARELA